MDRRALIWGLALVAVLVLVGVLGDAAGWWDLDDFVFGV